MSRDENALQGCICHGYSKLLLCCISGTDTASCSAFCWLCLGFRLSYCLVPCLFKCCCSSISGADTLHFVTKDSDYPMVLCNYHNYSRTLHMLIIQRCSNYPELLIIIRTRATCLDTGSSGHRHTSTN